MDRQGGAFRRRRAARSLDSGSPIAPGFLGDEGDNPSRVKGREMDASVGVLPTGSPVETNVRKEERMIIAGVLAEEFLFRCPSSECRCELRMVTPPQSRAEVSPVPICLCGIPMKHWSDRTSS